jgi:hypothetical protein
MLFAPRTSQSMSSAAAEARLTLTQSTLDQTRQDKQDKRKTRTCIYPLDTAHRQRSDADRIVVFAVASGEWQSGE